MATTYVDPSKVKFPPESLIEMVNEPAITTGGRQIASYMFTNQVASIEALNVSNDANFDLSVGADGISDKVVIRGDGDYSGPAFGIASFIPFRVNARKSMSVYGILSAGGPLANTPLVWNINVNRVTIIDKIRSGDTLTGREQDIADRLHLWDNISFGRIPRPMTLLCQESFKMFDEIVRISRTTGAIPALNVPTTIGYQINVPQGYIYTLLGVYCDDAIVAGGPYNDTFLVVDRDADPEYMKLDLSATPDQIPVPCFVPFRDKLVVKILSVTGVIGGFHVGFIYGIRKLSAADYIRWKLDINDPQIQADIDTLTSRWPDAIAEIEAGLR